MNRWKMRFRYIVCDLKHDCRDGKNALGNSMECPISRDAEFRCNIGICIGNGLICYNKQKRSGIF